MVALTGVLNETIRKNEKPLSLFTFDHRVQSTLAQQTEKTADNNGTEDEITNIVEATMALKDPDMIDGALVLDERKNNDANSVRETASDEYCSRVRPLRYGHRCRSLPRVCMCRVHCCRVRFSDA